MSAVAITCLVGFALMSAVYLIGGTIASIRTRMTIAVNKSCNFNSTERKLLNAPAEWLAASVIFTWLDRYLVAASLYCSLAVIILAVYDSEPATGEIVMSTLASVVFSVIRSSVACNNMGGAYRRAFLNMHPACESYAAYYGEREDDSLDIGEPRSAYFLNELVRLRSVSEDIIAGSYPHASWTSSDEVIAKHSKQESEE